MGFQNHHWERIFSSHPESRILFRRVLGGKTKFCCIATCCPRQVGTSLQLVIYTMVIWTAKLGSIIPVLKYNKDSQTSGGSRIFPRGGVNPPGGAWTRQIFPKTAWNRKNLDAQGGACVPHAPPPRSANADLLTFFQNGFIFRRNNILKATVPCFKMIFTLSI